MTRHGQPRWPDSTRSPSGFPNGPTSRRGKQRLDDLGQPHGGIVTGHKGWAIVGLHDPDGIEVRLYTLTNHHLGIPS
jgi:hypothetical protein